MLKCCKNKNSWYGNIFSFNQNNFVFNKTYFHYITFFLMISKNIFSFSQNKCVCSKNIFIIYIYIFRSSKMFLLYEFFIEYFSVSISGFPFVFIKVRILLSVCKLNNNTRMWILNKHIAFSSVMVIKNGKTMKCLSISGSSHRRCSVRKGVLKNSANFTEKHLCWSLF